MLKTKSKSGDKHQRNACSNYAPLERSVLRTRIVTKNKHKKKTQKLETKASSREGQCIPAGSRCQSTEKAVNYCVNNNHA